eukprot:COSAG01_NODE_4779_length_4745_cov_14.712043_8_plen_109_part_01
MLCCTVVPPWLLGCSAAQPRPALQLCCVLRWGKAECSTGGPTVSLPEERAAREEESQESNARADERQHAARSWASAMPVLQKSSWLLLGRSAGGGGRTGVGRWQALRGW